MLLYYPYDPQFCSLGERTRRSSEEVAHEPSPFGFPRPPTPAAHALWSKLFITQTILWGGGGIIGAIKGDTKSSDYSSHDHLLCMHRLFSVCWNLLKLSCKEAMQNNKTDIELQLWTSFVFEVVLACGFYGRICRS